MFAKHRVVNGRGSLWDPMCVPWLLVSVHTGTKVANTSPAPGWRWGGVLGWREHEAEVREKRGEWETISYYVVKDVKENRQILFIRAKV